MTAFEQSCAEREEQLSAIEKTILPKRWQDWHDGISTKRRMTAWKTTDGKFSGKVGLETVRVDGCLEWAAVREMRTQESRMHCVAWVLYLIDQKRGTIGATGKVSRHENCVSS